MIRVHLATPGDTCLTLAERYYRPSYPDQARTLALLIWRHNQEVIPSYNQPIAPGTHVTIPHVPQHATC